MMGHIFEIYSRTSLVHEGLPFCIMMVLDNAPAHPHVLQDLHRDIKFIFLPPNTMSLLQPMDQGMINMFKAHYLQKMWHSLSIKCDVSLDELEKTAQAPEKTEVELQKDVVRHYWLAYTICDAIWHVRDAWKEVTESCIRGSWKKLCLELAVNFWVFDLSERLLEECLKCLELARKVGLDEEDVDSLLEMIGEELSTEELTELEKQRCQLEEEEEEAAQYPTAPSKMKQLTVKILQCFYGMINQVKDYLEEVEPDVKRARLSRCKVMFDLAHYEQLLYKKRREATQAPLDAFFLRVSLTEASASDNPHTSEEPHTSDEPPASDKPRPSTSTGGFICPSVPSPSSSNTDDPGVV